MFLTLCFFLRVWYSFDILLCLYGKGTGEGGKRDGICFTGGLLRQRGRCDPGEAVRRKAGDRIALKGDRDGRDTREILPFGPPSDL